MWNRSMIRSLPYAVALGVFSCALQCLLVRAQPDSSCAYFCPDGTCIPSMYVCDGISHCADAKDELENCPCSSLEFQCHFGDCINADWECNGYPNCVDGSDEHQSCPVCGPRRFQCDNGLCINHLWECDGDNDCGDNSDEQGCPVCSSDSYPCDNGACIDAAWECDGENDCGDWTDEHLLCQEVSCEDHQFLCDNNRCIYDGFECDGEDDCGDNSDESTCLPRSCGGELTATSGTFISPNYPSPYPNDAKCTWIFKGPVGTVIQVYFPDFRLQNSEYSEEHGGHVCYDWVEILEKKWSRVAEGYCGTGALGATITTIENYLWLQFRSGNSTVDTGFTAEYNIVTHPCQDIICNNGGTCVADGIVFQCQCLAGYTGLYCQTQESNPCQNIVCGNGGRCLVSNGNARCVCQPGYAGHYCQIVTNPCQNINCVNGGSCIADGDSFRCLCPVEYTGAFCETVVNPCHDVICLYGGTCYPYGTDGINIFTCQCRDGFSGQYCQIVVNPCDEDVICLNGGTCYPVGTDGISFTCQCPEDYSGQYCEIVAYPCQDVICLNGGTCYPYGTGGNIFTCQCQEGYSGQYCQIDINECSSNPCQNGGKCEDLGNRFSCICPAGFEGDKCENEVNRVGCKHPGDIENGFVISDGKSEPYSAGQKLQLVCREGYMLDGRSEIYCTDEIRWSHPLPKCNAEGGDNENIISDHTAPVTGAAAGGVVVIIILIIVLVVVCRKMKSSRPRGNETECRQEPTVFFVRERTQEGKSLHDNDIPQQEIGAKHISTRYGDTLSNRPPVPNPRPDLQDGGEYEVIGGFSGMQASSASFQNNRLPPDYMDVVNDKVKLPEYSYK